MRFILLALGLMAFTSIHSKHDTPEKVDEEFAHIEKEAQGRQFTVWQTTPNVSQLRDGEIVVFSTGAIKLMYRVGQEIYAVSGSCITVRR